MENRPLKTLIVDDERIARQVLREELEAVPEILVVGEAEDGMQALRQIADLRPDLVFLDVQMPVMGGFEVVRNLGGTHFPAIVMVTAYDQYAIRAFEAGAIDYLLKPVRDRRLHQAVKRASSIVGKPLEIAKDLANLVSKIVGRVGREYFFIDAADVLAFQAERELVWILTPKRRFLATQTLRAMEARLPRSTFVRVHRSVIVNVNHIRKVSALSSNRWLLTVGSDLEFTVSKRLAQHVRRILNW